MKEIQTDKAPKAIGPYSQAIISENFVFTAGQIAIDPKTNEFKNGTIEEQAEQVLENLKAVLEAAGSKLEKTVKVTVYLKDLNDFQKMNSIYEKFFTNKPARSTVQVSALPRNAKIEIDIIAEKS